MVDGSKSIDDYINENKVMMFSKSYCPFCTQAKNLLQQKGVEFFALELDQIPEGAQLQNALAAKTKQRTGPNTFIGGVHVGGCDDTQAKAKNGVLKKLCDDAGVANKL